LKPLPCVSVGPVVDLILATEELQHNGLDGIGIKVQNAELPWLTVENI
jgi:hypothetical protein